MDRDRRSASVASAAQWTGLLRQNTFTGAVQAYATFVSAYNDGRRNVRPATSRAGCEHVKSSGQHFFVSEGVPYHS